VLGVHPDTSGPRVRLGILWFLVAMAAATAGRWWSGVLWAVVAGLAARELLVAWSSAVKGPAAVDSPEGEEGPTRPIAWLLWTVVGLAAVVPVALAAGTGLGGLVLAVVALVSLALGRSTAPDGPGMAVPIAVVLPAIAAGCVVVVVAAQLWAGLFLISAVSLFDAGNYVAGAESSSRFEGPVTGIVGVLAVTFTMATFQAAPFDTLSAAIVGTLVAVACPVGVWATSALLPGADVHVRAVRRLDAYLIAAPVFVVGVWLAT
jgi:hypothetical protein